MSRHASLFVASIVVVIASPTFAGGLGTNLVVNGNAESGGTTGWLTDGVETVATSVPGFVGLPPGESIGRLSFQGGLGPIVQTITQTMDLSSFATQIDAGQIEANFHVLVQSRAIAGASDTVTGTLHYLNEGGVTVLALGIADPHVVIDLPDWDAVNDTSVLPSGVRSAALSFTFTRDVGASTDAYIDNAELVLTNVDDCASDLNGDDVTNAADLAILLGAWGTAGGSADLDGSGTVGAADLAILLGAWGPCA